jgi:glycine betaine/proline transport system ATP-binding protein
MSVKIKADKCTKIYGDDPDEALKLLNEGVSRDEILKKTGQTVGVDRASFEINEGEIFVLIGLSGSGKSTLLRCINGLLRIDSGEMFVEEHAIHKMDEKQLRVLRGKMMGMVFQHFAILPNRSVRENVAFGLELAGVDKQERFEKAQKTLETVGLEAWGSKLPGELSGGMKQRVGLARALCMDSSILLMDEPFSALDALIKAEMQEELLNLQQEIKKTIVFVTHDLDEALRLGDKIAIMRDGVIEQLGTAEEILSNPANDYVENFLQGVDVSKILLAENIARKPKETVTATEGIMSVLRKIERATNDYLYVVAPDRKLRGIVYLDEVLELRNKGEHSIADAIKKVSTVDSSSPMQDIYPLLKDANESVAVIDDKERFLGEVTRRSVLANLAQRKGEVK